MQGLYCNPLSLDLRRQYAGLNNRRTDEYDREADRLISAGEIEAALSKMELAQSILPTQSRLSKMNWAQNVIEFNQGMSFYNDKRYREAVFQFKKVLARDPDHADARRQLNFAQRFEIDSNEALNDRFGRIE